MSLPGGLGDPHIVHGQVRIEYNPNDGDAMIVSGGIRILANRRKPTVLVMLPQDGLATSVELPILDAGPLITALSAMQSWHEMDEDPS